MSLFRKHLRTAAASLGILLAASVAANAFDSASGYVTTGLNLRAGPGTGYPAVAVMAAGDAVLVYGCTTGYGWCDIGWSGNRGWASGQYLQMDYQGSRAPIMTEGTVIGIPFVLFSIDTYWQQYYPSRPFYRDRDRYQGQGFNPQGQFHRGPRTPHPTQPNRQQNHPSKPPVLQPQKPGGRQPIPAVCGPGTHASGGACVRN